MRAVLSAPTEQPAELAEELLRTIRMRQVTLLQLAVVLVLQVPVALVERAATQPQHSLLLAARLVRRGPVVLHTRADSSALTARLELF
jgi:hypothetical protein